MLQFERFKLTVKAHNPSTNETKAFGRDIVLGDGLNFIVGENTSGKTTIAKCFYYVLGMEELIEAKRGIDSLDKSVKDQFTATRDGMEELWYVRTAYVEAKMCNENDEHIIIKRYIKQNGSTSTNTIYVRRKIGEVEDAKEYFLHNAGDHTPPNGFYHMLAEFSGLDLLKYQGLGDEDVLMYMQTVFALSFVEQTRGWSDFFATIRGMNMYRPKQRLIEYALNVETNNELINRRKLQEKIKELDSEWRKILNEAKNVAMMNDLIFVDLGNLKEQKSQPEQLSFGNRDGNESVERYVNKLRSEIQSINSESQTTNESEKVALYKKIKQEFDELSEKYRDFIENYNSDKNKLASVLIQLDRLDDEIKKNQNLMQASNLITSNQIDYCPVCHQEMPVQTESVNIEAQKEDLKRNVKQLTMQKGFLESMRTRLQNSLEEKGIYSQYYEQLVDDKKLELNMAFEGMGDDASIPSRHSMYKQAEAQLKYSRLVKVLKKKSEWEESLKLLYEAYLKNQNQLNELTGNKKDTLNQKLLKMETEFSKLASKYGYSSNGRHLLGLLMEEKSGYCYFPIVLYGNDEMIPVRSMSSASDFVRCIWAYYTALLLAAERHPGFLLLDEPCQQSMSEDSLKALFKNCSQIKQKQVLLFCSSSPKTEESEKYNRQKSIDDMLREANLKEGEDFAIHHISGHSVDELSAM